MKTAENNHLLPVIESLESRRLFSAAHSAAVVASTDFTHPMIVTPKSSSDGESTGGSTIYLTADAPYIGSVGFITSSLISSTTPSVSIAWGDGDTTTGTLQAATVNGASGYDIIGTHTYLSAGTYQITTTTLLRPISQPGQLQPQFLVMLPPVTSTAVVAPPAVDSSGGVTIDETAGRAFTVNLGQFTTPAPGRGLKVVIHWGADAATSGTLQAGRAVGLDELSFDVVGHHRYHKAGIYQVRSVVTKASTTGSGQPLSIADILSTIDVVD